MKKITEAEALRIMDEADLPIYREERNSIEKWANENDKEFHTDFYLEDDGTIIVYFMDGKTIIQPRTVLRSQKRPVGRPSKGTTKKLSLTLRDDLWDFVEREAAGNISGYLRKLIEKEVYGDYKK